MKRYWIFVLSAVLVAGLSVPSVMAIQAGTDIVEVIVTGQGTSEDAALRDALRKALEQGGGVEISSRSQVENFELIRDTIYARADGIVTDYKVLEQGDAAGGVKFCKITARVSKSAIATSWGEVQNVLDQVGRPGVAVFIQERIDGVIQDSSILESQIENRLLAAGFDIYARQQLDAIARKEMDDAVAEDNIAKMQAILKDFGAQIFITGTAQANAAGVRDLYGEPTAMYNGDAMIKMYYTDTARMLASESLANWRGAARGYKERSPQAGKKALENAGQELVERCYQNVMRQWATQITAGGEIRLEVEGMNISEAIRLKRILERLDPDRITRVNHALSKGTVTFRINARMTAETFVEYLVDGEIGDMIEVIDLKTNRIQAKKVSR